MRRLAFALVLAGLLSSSALAREERADPQLSAAGVPQLKNAIWRLSRIDIDGKRGADTAGTPPLWHFCAGGTFEARRGTTVDLRGTYTVAGTTLTLTDSKDGGRGVYEVDWNADEKLMSLTEGRAAFRFAFHDAKDCSL